MKHARLIFCVGTMLAALSGSALTATTNGITWTYSVVNGGATISGSSRTSGSIDIPSKLGGYNVREIGIAAFRKCSLTSVTIPDTVTHINTNAFRECYILSSVTIGNGVKTIDNAAFKDCSKLTNVTLPDNLTLIHNYAFAGCTSLTEMTVPDKVTYLRPHAFEDCTGLKSVKIGKAVSKISDNCFARCSSLTSVIFTGDAPTYFGTGVFTGVASGCCVYINRNSSGWDVVIPGSWHDVLICYMNCKVRFDANGGACAIASLDVEGGKTIGTLPVPTRQSGNSADFLGWFTWAGVRVTESTIVTADMTLYAHWDEIWLYGDDEEGVVAITGVKDGVVPTGDLTIPAKIDGRTVTAIAEHAFDGCVGLTSVTILGNNTRIDNGAFYGCTGLTNVTIGSVADTSTSTTSSSQWGHYIIAAYPSGIGDYAFCGCSELVEVSIDMPELIGDFAFQDCQMLNKLIFEGDTYEPTLGVGTFDGVSSNCRAYIRHASASGWPSAAYGSWNGIRIDYIDHVVTFDANGGTGGKSTVLDTGDVITVPVVTRAGYSFAGWVPVVAAVMPSNDVTYKAQWTPNKYRVVFDANGGRGGTTNILDCGAAIVVPTVTRTGYAFKGWSPRVPATVPAGNVTYTAQWEINKYTVTFDAAGGVCDTAALTVDHDSTIEALPVPSREKAVFLGWFTEPDGGEVFDNQNVAITSNLSLYAHWLTEIPRPVIASNQGAVFPTDSCEVGITCPLDGATIYYTDDGTTPKRYDDYLYAGPVTITETTTFKAVAVFGGLKSAYTTVTITKKPLTLEEVLDVGDGVAVATSADVSWKPIFDASAKAGDTTARSGTIGDRTNTWLSATVSGAGSMSFWCKTSCEHDEENGMFATDRLMVYTNDVEIAAWRMDGETDWTERTLTFDGGENTVKWVYYKDKSDAGGEDCAWVDGVTWTPRAIDGVMVEVGGGKTVTVPQAWFAEKTTRAALDDAANGRKIWECYVLGLDPEDETNDFRIVSFPIKADGTPDLANIVFDPPQVRWNVPATYKLKGAATLDGPWEEVEDGGGAGRVALPLRFFKVEVQLP